MNYKLPKARNNNIVVQQFEEEILIYHLNDNKAFCLNETSAKVFNACGEQMSFSDLKHKFLLTDDIIFLALDELSKCNLLAEDTDHKSPFAGQNRREVIKKIGLATMIALPVISSIVAPTSIQAASGLQIGATCSNDGDCASGACVPTVGYIGPRPILCCVSSSDTGAPGSSVCSSNPCGSNNGCCSGSASPGAFSCSAPFPNACVCNP